MSFRAAIPWLTALTIVVADRITKILIIKHIDVGGFHPVFPGFALTQVHNRGIAFSLFNDGGPLTRVLLHGVILTAVVLIAWMLFQHGHQQRLAGLAFGLILGGALGNLMDRVIHGWVIDWAHFWVRIGDRTWSWPNFNVADSAISIGACLLILSEILHSRRNDNDAPDGA